jgi:fimbrial chaperone protein
MRAQAIIAALAASTLCAAACQAASIEVVPIALELPAAGGPTKLRLVNHGDDAVNVQVEAFAWKQDGGEAFADTDAVVLSPPLAHLEPRASQIVRLLVQPSPDKGERAFRIVVTQLPDMRKAVAGAKVLLQFNVPLFVGDGPRAAADLHWSLHRESAGLRLAVHNEGARRGKLVDLALVGAAARLPVASGALTYVLAGAKRSWNIEGAPPEGLRLEGYDEMAGRRIAVPLAVTD